MNFLYDIIFTSFITGLLLILVSRLKLKYLAEIVGVAVSVLIFVYTIKIFLQKEIVSYSFNFDSLARFISLWAAFFGIVIVFYSLTSIRYYLKDEIAVNKYHGYIILTLGSSICTVLADNFIIFLTFWGITGLFLYLIINLTFDGAEAAKKTLIIIGATDCLMILGFAIMWYVLGHNRISQLKFDLDLTFTNKKVLVFAFICLVLASLAKAGAFPLHTWIPDMAEVTPIPAVAFLPASLDKLLGIYFLSRICTTMFKLDNKLTIFLMLIGAITIISAVFMAMIQHNYRKLLSYHAVSQVGYMVLGIATGTLGGIAGGLFHMLNNAIYKSCLFLCGGSVEQKSGTSDLDRLGGYSKVMPLTFFSFLTAALAISGVPPLNGFVSKWMVYQGVIQKLLEVTDYRLQIVIVLCLISAVFGSALTLASFIKLTHAMFLGQKSSSLEINTEKLSKETYWTQWAPTLILAVLCITFGIFAFELPLKYFIYPSLGENFTSISTFIGLWQPSVATLLIIVGIIVGFIIYLLSNVKLRTVSVYLLGELGPNESKISGTEFYNTIKEMSGFKLAYFFAEKKFFDIYYWFKNLFIGIGSILSFLHTGNLHFYLSWVVIGLVLLLLLVTL